MAPIRSSAHAFLSALEDSGSVGPGTGWEPMPFVIEGEQGRLAAALPAYLKSHSQGEYVFDHSWADAWQRAGGRYYPKLQICGAVHPGHRPALPDPRCRSLPRRCCAAAEQFCERNGVSSAHATFIAPEQLPLFEAAGWLIRAAISSSTGRTAATPRSTNS